MRRLATAVTAIALLSMAACSTSKDDEAGTDSTSATSAAPTDTGSGTETTLPGTVVDDRAPGVTDTSVKVGIMYTDFTRVGPLLGYDQGDYEGAYRAEIDAINEAGGINGRTIDPVFVPVDPSNTDGPTAACSKLAEDEQVFIAVGFVFDAAGECLVVTQETLTFGGNQTEELLGRAKVGWWTLEAGDEQRQIGLQAMVDKGAFSDKLAVVSTSSDQAFYEEVVQPMLAEVGITPVSVAYMDPTFDANQTYSDAQTIAERFRADGADQVLMLSLGNTFPQGLVRTDWRPQLVFDTVNSAAVYYADATNDLGVLEGAIAGGGFDAANEYVDLGSPTAECIERQESAGFELKLLRDVQKGESQQIVSSLIACKYVALLVAGLEAAGPTLNYGTFTTAMHNLGEVMIPGFPDPWFFDAESTDGSPEMYLYEWDASVKSMVVADA